MPTPARPRDYALTPDDAARLRRGGWRRLVAAIGSPRGRLQPAAGGGADHARSRRSALVASIPRCTSRRRDVRGLSTVGSRAGDRAAARGRHRLDGAPIAAAVAPGCRGTGRGRRKSAVPAAAAPAAAPVAGEPAAAPAPAASAPGQDAFGPVQSAGGAAAPPSVADFGDQGSARGTPARPDLDAGGAADGSARSGPIVLARVRPAPRRRARAVRDPMGRPPPRRRLTDGRVTRHVRARPQGRGRRAAGTLDPCPRNA